MARPHPGPLPQERENVTRRVTEVGAFETESGELAWHLHTKDDGPTAAVLTDGLAVFNTESCTLETVETATGKVVWEKWLEDPLLAQPAVGGARVVMVYPWDGQHCLGAFRLKSGSGRTLKRSKASGA